MYCSHCDSDRNGRRNLFSQKLNAKCQGFFSTKLISSRRWSVFKFKGWKWWHVVGFVAHLIPLTCMRSTCSCWGHARCYCITFTPRFDNIGMSLPPTAHHQGDESFFRVAWEWPSSTDISSRKGVMNCDVPFSANPRWVIKDIRKRYYRILNEILWNRVGTENPYWGACSFHFQEGAFMASFIFSPGRALIKSSFHSTFNFSKWRILQPEDSQTIEFRRKKTFSVILLQIPNLKVRHRPTFMVPFFQRMLVLPARFFFIRKTFLSWVRTWRCMMARELKIRTTFVDCGKYVISVNK